MAVIACEALALSWLVFCLISSPTNTIDPITPSAASVSRIALPDMHHLLARCYMRLWSGVRIGNEETTATQGRILLYPVDPVPFAHSHFDDSEDEIRSVEGPDVSCASPNARLLFVVTPDVRKPTPQATAHLPTTPCLGAHEERDDERHRQSKCGDSDPQKDQLPDSRQCLNHYLPPACHSHHPRGHGWQRL